jgi:hypothetical protein
MHRTKQKGRPKSTIRCMLILTTTNLIFYHVNFANEHINSLCFISEEILTKDAQKHLLVKDTH